MDWNNKEKSRLIQAILALETANEARRFLRDLMTKREIEDFAKRFEAAELLSQKVPYSEIEKKTGFSSTTVARVSKWLNGDEGGYRAIISKLHHHAIPL
ncbi:MAG: YerC/YecD family TrpR-related protein [Minisyncoccia bacterium]|jgi:TrpR-related protein YerC/YecD